MAPTKTLGRMAPISLAVSVPTSKPATLPFRAISDAFDPADDETKHAALFAPHVAALGSAKHAAEHAADRSSLHAAELPAICKAEHAAERTADDGSFHAAV